MPTKTCTVCDQAKEIDQFPKKKSGRHGVAASCKACRAVWAKQHYAEHAEEEKAKRQAYVAANRDAIYAKNRAYRTERYRSDPEFRARQIAAGRKGAMEARRKVFLHYGGDPPRCACCGETEDAFLTLDHVNGDGHIHRRQIGSKGGNGVLYWLVRNGFPEGYAILCWNCHMAKDKRGACPHQS